MRNWNAVGRSPDRLRVRRLVGALPAPGLELGLHLLGVPQRSAAREIGLEGSLRADQRLLEDELPDGLSEVIVRPEVIRVLVRRDLQLAHGRREVSVAEVRAAEVITHIGAHLTPRATELDGLAQREDRRRVLSEQEVRE